MARLRRPFHSLITAGLVSLAPVMVSAQSPTLIAVPPPARTVMPAAEWSKVTIEKLNTCWMESHSGKRASLLHEVAEQTPSHLAYLTRVLQQNNAEETSKLVRGLKDYFSLIRRITWSKDDLPHVQRIVASWSVTVPQLVKLLPAADLSAQQRRVLEQVLVDLAALCKDAQLGTPVARQTWQSQAALLGQYSTDPKLSVRLAALSVIEAIGPDAQQANGALVKCLADPDSFVRWAAVRAMHSIGIDPQAAEALSKLKKDEDPQVRDAALLALATPASPVNTLATMQQKPVVNEKQSVVNLTSTQNTRLPEPSNKPSELPKLDLTPLPAVSKTKTETRSTVPVVPAKKTESVPVSSKPAQPAVLPSVMPGTPLQTPVTTGTPVSQSVPLFTPPTVSQPVRDTTSAVQPASATVPARVNPVQVWLPKLRQGTVEEQLVAVRELGKLKADAGDAVPALAELLLKSDIAVRREVPNTLAMIGKRARLATAVLERCLQDEDTDVKVNAARALLELADK
ncbi:MAG: HEAT repeat domain-containing protein [Gemmatales bacterium]